MPKAKLDGVTGVVALSYLVLIPVGAYIFWRRVETIDRDVTAMWYSLKMPTKSPENVAHFNKLRNILRGE